MAFGLFGECRQELAQERAGLACACVLLFHEYGLLFTGGLGDGAIEGDDFIDSFLGLFE